VASASRYVGDGLVDDLEGACRAARGCNVQVVNACARNNAHTKLAGSEVAERESRGLAGVAADLEGCGTRGERAGLRRRNRVTVVGKGDRVAVGIDQLERAVAELAA